MTLREHVTEPDATRFEVIWNAIYGAVFGFVGRRCHPDRVANIVEDTFLTAWRRPEDCPADPRPWLLAIARGLLANDRSQSSLSECHLGSIVP